MLLAPDPVLTETVALEKPSRVPRSGGDVFVYTVIAFDPVMDTVLLEYEFANVNPVAELKVVMSPVIV
jgi:hypothetical protein